MWHDADEDGFQSFDGAGNLEPGIPGVTLTVLWAGFDGVFGTGDDMDYGTQTTDANGYYLFSGLPHGTYAVTVGSAPAPYLHMGPSVLNLTLDALVGGVGLTADFPVVLPSVSTEALPKTGFEADVAALLAGVMVGLGALIVVITRRREDEDYSVAK